MAASSPLCTATSMNAAVSPPSNDRDVINLLEYLYVVLKHKRLIVLAAFLGAMLGFVVAQIRGPSWVAQAVIGPREADSKQASSFSGFGAIGGLVASQLNLGGNASLERIDIVLGTRKFNAEMILERGLRNLIYEVSYPREYRRYFVSNDSTWDTANFKPATLAHLGGHITAEYLERELNKNNTMTLTVRSPDSLFSYRLLESYLVHLNKYIRNSVQTEAQENVAYLEQQLTRIVDPLLREKMQGLIANEMEKMMVVSKEAFQVIDPTYLARDFAKKTTYPLVFAAGFLLLAISMVVFAHLLSSAATMEKNTSLLGGIKRELTRI